MRMYPALVRLKCRVFGEDAVRGACIRDSNAFSDSEAFRSSKAETEKKEKKSGRCSSAGDCVPRHGLEMGVAVICILNLSGPRSGLEARHLTEEELGQGSRNRKGEIREFFSSHI